MEILKYARMDTDENGNRFDLSLQLTGGGVGATFLQKSQPPEILFIERCVKFVSAAKKNVKAEAGGFSLDSVLKTATVKKEAKSSKSKVPVIPVPQELQAKAARIRKVKEELDSLESQYDTLSAEIVEGVSPLREGLCKRQGYVSSVRIPDGTGMSVGVSWSDKYSKIDAGNEEALRAVVGDRFEAFFASSLVITVRDISEESLTELVNSVGAERFAQFFAVERTFSPTSLFTQEQFNLAAEQRQQLALAGVKQHKPSIKVK